MGIKLVSPPHNQSDKVDDSVAILWLRERQMSREAFSDARFSRAQFCPRASVSDCRADAELVDSCRSRSASRPRTITIAH